MHRITLSLALSELVVLVGCTQPNGASPEPEPTDPQLQCEQEDESGGDDGEKLLRDPEDRGPDQLLDPANPQAGTIEVDVAWPDRVIDVCFTEPGHSTERGWIREAIRGSWQAVSGVRFANWDTCSSKTDGDISIELLEYDDGGLSQLGTNSVAVHPSMQISVNFEEPGCGNFTDCDETVDANGKTGRQNCIEGIAKHEFGHALGLRHEQAHPDETCSSDEPLDAPGYDGQELWSYDAESLMNYCGPRSVENAGLSHGDVRTINSLYSGQVVAFSQMDFVGDSQALAWGSWLPCDMSDVGSHDITSIVVPPGMRARVCIDEKETYCETFTESANLLDPLCNNVGKIVVDAGAHLYEDPGFRGERSQHFEPGTHAGGGLGALGENIASSMIVPPGISAKVCDQASGDGACTTRRGHEAMEHDLPNGIDDAVSFVEIRPQVVTYTGAGYRDELFSYDLGTYRASDGTLAHAETISSFSIPYGMQIRVCTEELDGQGAGKCSRVRRSQPELPPELDNAIQHMEVGWLDSVGLDPICDPGFD